MTIAILANSALSSYGGGRQAVLDRIAAALRQESLPASIELAAGPQLSARAAAAAAAGARAVVAVGGDGTISAVAGALVGTQTPLGLIPMGTFNHFAHDLGIPLKLDEAVSVLAAGVIRPIDVGAVNGRTFVNNASIGAYPALVLDREEQRMKFGRPKWRAMLIAGARVLHRFPRVEVRLALGAEATWCETPCVLVGNNRYRFDAFSLGSRSALDHGRLSVYAAKANTRLAVLALGIRALLGKLDEDENLIALELEEFWIESRRQQLHVGIDGEVVRLSTPLHFCIRPRSLNVIVPG